MLAGMTPNVSLAHWRGELRRSLLAQRVGQPAELRQFRGRAISRRLLDCFTPASGSVVGIYWPIRGEFDPRFVAMSWRRAGVPSALPVVTERNAAMEFHAWWPGAVTVPGVFNLPCPQGTARVIPDLVLMPPVGWDGGGYRLGYGAGYYDRTLASMQPAPLKIGVGFELSRIASIDPQAHDIAMDFMVTEAAVYRVAHGGLRAMGSAADVRRELRAIGAPVAIKPA